MLFDVSDASMQGWPQRLREHYPQMKVATAATTRPAWTWRQRHAAGHEGQRPAADAVDRIEPRTFVGEVVMKTEMTRLPHRRQAKGCAVQVGTDMLFEMIPAYLEFFGFGTASPEELRAVAQLKY
jgi:shikimate dehydrogenase